MEIMRQQQKHLTFLHVCSRRSRSDALCCPRVLVKVCYTGDTLIQNHVGLSSSSFSRRKLTHTFVGVEQFYAFFFTSFFRPKPDDNYLQFMRTSPRFLNFISCFLTAHIQKEINSSFYSSRRCSNVQQNYNYKLKRSDEKC